MANEILPSIEYLQRFSEPLWELLELDYCKPLKIIEGQRGKYPFVIMDIEHRQHGMFGDHNLNAVTTFFIVEHLKVLNKPFIASAPIGHESSVDQKHVYLAIPSKTIRPGDWGQHLQYALNIADALTECESDFEGKKEPPRTYSPVGGGLFIHGFFALIFAIFTILFLGFALIEVHRFWFTHLPADESMPSGWTYLLGAVFTFWCTLQSIKKVKSRR